MTIKLKNLCMSLLLFVTTILCMSFSASAEVADDYASAQLIDINTMYSESIHEMTDCDWYKVEIPYNGYINISFNHENVFNSNPHYRVAVYDENINNVFSYDIPGNCTSDETYKVGLKAGLYYVKMYNGTYVTHKDYSFSVNFVKSSYWEIEKNEKYVDSNIVSLNRKYSGTIMNMSDQDWYKVEIPDNGYISILLNHENVFNSNPHYRVAVYDANINNIFSYDIPGNSTSHETFKVGLEAGTYFIKVSNGTYGTVKEYSFNVKYAKSNYWEIEKNETYPDANKIIPGKKYSGSIMYGNDCDWYKINITKTANYDFVFYHEANGGIGNHYTVTIYDSDTQSIISTYVKGNESSVKKSLVLSKGIYYVKVAASTYPKDDVYKFEVKEFKLGKTSKLTATPKSNEIKLSWTTVKGASGYKVYQYNYTKKKSTAIKTLSGTSYVIKNLKSNTKYRFSVKAYALVNGEKVWSDVYTIVETKTYPAIVSKLTATQTTSSIKLNWSKVSGATGYKVYSYTDGKWKVIKTTSSNSHTIKKLQSGKKYKFAVKAYIDSSAKTVYSSEYKIINTATKCKTPTLKVTSTKKGIANASWTNVAGETGYELYGSSKKSSGFKKLATTKANVVKSSKNKLKSKKTYYFKVRAYKKTDSGTVYSAWSSVKSVKVK